MGRVIGLVGIAVAIVGVIITVNVARRGEEGVEKVADQIERKVHGVTDRLDDLSRGVRVVVADLEISVNKAKAHAAADHGDYLDYVVREPAKSDIEMMVRLATFSAEAKGPALAHLQQQLLMIYSDYEDLTGDIPSLPREQVRVRGILLSHRRQMGVIVAAIRQSNPPDELFQLVGRIQGSMDES